MKYRADFWVFKPYVNLTANKYLVGLPVLHNQFNCPSGSCDLGTDDLTAMTWYLYDDSATIANAPSTGKLTGRRTFVCFANSSNTCYSGYNANYTRNVFSDELYEYDAWGNQTKVKQFSGYGWSAKGNDADSHLATEGLRETATSYDTTYYTFATSLTNALGQTTYLTYNYDYGLPKTQTDPNDVINGLKTEIAYDELGRLTKVARPGDSLASPTMQISYSYGTTLFWTELSQRIKDNSFYKVRKFYNGLGQLIQEQIVGAVLETGTKDILVDYQYDRYGQVWQQSMPYAVATGSGYRTPSGVYTSYTYDLLGRIVLVQNPDTTSTSTSYSVSGPDRLKSWVTNANGATTISYADSFGRVTEVDAPAGPSVFYQYDSRDQLKKVTYNTAITEMTYDAAGRKTSQTDPDLGQWTYGYDGAGNLTSQKDARACTTTLTYDSLNRLTQKTYAGSNCSSTPTVKYQYDHYNGYSDYNGPTSNAIGRRTAMTDVSGHTLWSYDPRGRQIREQKVVTGSGTFLTQWGYNSADAMEWIMYPGGNAGQAGEKVTTNYHPQLVPNSVIGHDTYVQETKYEAAGRVELRTLGTNKIQTDYTYFPWTAEGGRLKYLQSINFTTQAYLQNWGYLYDDVGNIELIHDKRLGNPQVLNFSYDTLNRLVSASATSGTAGNYTQSYSYNSATGNLATKAGTALTYGAQAASCPNPGLNKPHAAIAYGSNTYCYDLNGNMVRRTVGGKTYNLVYDVENHLVSVSGGTTAAYVYDGDGNRVTSKQAYQNLAAGAVVTGSGNLYHADVIVNGDTQPTSGMGPDREFGYTSSGLHYAQVDLGAVYSVDKVRIWHYHPGGRTYHKTRTQVSADGITWTDIFSSTAQTEYPETPEGKTTTFSKRQVRYVRDWLNGSTSNAGDHWVEIEVWGWADVTYIGNYYEWKGSPNNAVKYYYAGSERVAMRQGNGTGWTGVAYLLSDHLGSTSITADPVNGNKLTEQRYYPWGEERYANGTLNTTIRFTGQRQEKQLGGSEGLYYYGARWYDPVLGRFASPDTIVPKPYNPQDWDRYAYVRNNPVKYVDPTGNMAIRDGEVNDKFFVSDYKKYKPTIWLNGYSEYSLPDYSQLQLNDSTGCAPYSMAMAINLALNDNIMTGPGVEYYAEKTFRRVPNLGMPPSLQEAVLQDILLPLNVDYQQGFHELLVNNLKEGNPTVISISWETNVDIVKKLAAKLVGGGEGPIVGHAMVLVGYNPYEKQYKFLDPGSIDKVITSMDVNSFNQIWLEQPNVFIPSGSMVTIRR